MEARQYHYAISSDFESLAEHHEVMLMVYFTITSPRDYAGLTFGLSTVLRSPRSMRPTEEKRHR